jgi:hypothetical protein
MVAAVLLGEALWVLAELGLGIHLQAPAGTGYPEPVTIGPLTVALTAALLPLIGWAVLAGLERLTQRAPQIWLGLALLVLLASLAMPLSGTGVSAANRAVLVLMHLVVGGTAITALYRSSASSQLPKGRTYANVVPGEVA